MTQTPGDAKQADSVSAGASPLTRLLRRALEAAGGWLPFDRFMALALYAPGLGYYARGRRQFGALPGVQLAVFLRLARAFFRLCGVGQGKAPTGLLI